MSFVCRLVSMLALVIAVAGVPALSSAWPHDALGVLVQSSGSSSRSASDGAGGVFVAYTMYGTGSGTMDVFVQRLDANGQPLWAAPGVLVCSAPDAQWVEGIASDGYGGCVVAWSDNRDFVAKGSDYYAQRISASGALQWPVSNGTTVVSAPTNQSQLRMGVDAGSGNVWFVWADPRNVATGSDIYAQTITLWSGAVNLGPGAAVCVASGDQNSPDLAVDLYGYARVVWADMRSGVYDIYAQSMAWNGVPQWAANGVAVCSAVSQQYEPRITMLSGGRAVVVWGDYRGADFDIYAQMLNDYSGSAYWAANGIPVCAATGHQSSPVVIADANGDLVFAWTDQRRGFPAADLYAQKLDQTGVALWTTNGAAVRVASGAVSSLQMIPDAVGGAYLAWGDARLDASDVYAQRINSWGGSQWTANGVKVGAGPNSQAGPTLVASAAGGVRITWDDYGSSPWGAKHQYVDEWGYMGANPILASVKDIPNDQGGQVKVSWYGSSLDTDPLYRNISDYVVYRSVPTALAAQLARAGVAADDGGVSLDGKRFLRTTAAAQDYFWEELAHVTPRHLAQYSYVAATEGDSMGGSNKKTAFMIMAIANYGSAWWTSNADSGYSVDNVAPAAPAPLTGQYTPVATRLHWDPNAEADLAGYRVYRG
ncbi:MAG: hypothetical protein HZA61_03410, partial [Candidatus Eisenbacteria bacterium]|nr:hypothetical protein [Candidatus Eisenbacteria bacterium]